MARTALDAAPLSPEERLVQDYRSTFGSGPGARVLVDLRKRFGRRRSFVPRQPDTSAFNEGQRDVYLTILAYLDPDMTDTEEDTE